MGAGCDRGGVELVERGDEALGVGAGCDEGEVGAEKGGLIVGAGCEVKEVKEHKLV